MRAPAAPRRLKGTGGVAFLTSVQVDQAKASLHLRDAGNGPSDTWLYMAIAADDRGQEASANAFLRGMQGIFGTETISCDGTKSDGFVVAANPASLPEAMWGNVRSHENLYIMSCRFCGRTVFANMHGGETSFCSPSCRSACRRMLRGQGRRESSGSDAGACASPTSSCRWRRATTTACAPAAYAAPPSTPSARRAAPTW
ncbi:hypothetical protein [Paratractidigestivibacter sp.]|uniref:hypothetical protein n=1 Tax=Paratractidigestivibacter sp. TaxID=2847316 RepID=UPI002ABE5B2C|nr:hypothetical protein [Paratractidigestivibacter sp.]